MPRPPKARKLPSTGLVALQGGLVVPDPERHWLVETRRAWTSFWSSPLATVVQRDTDAPAVRRLFGLRDERERMARVIRKQRVVLGSRGQLRANPLYAQMIALDAELRQLEDRLGLSPIARLRLGVTFGDAARSLADLNRELENDDDPDAEAPDLRLTLNAPASPEPRGRGHPVDGAPPGPRPG